MNLINQELYNQILINMPIICVDGVLLNDEGQILFLKRENEPAKNEWWFPGGRIQKNELLKDAIVRKFKEETDISVEILDYIGTTETIFDTGPYGIPVHTVNFTFLLKSENSNVQIDNLHSDYVWERNFDNLNLNSEIHQLLKSYLQI